MKQINHINPKHYLPAMKALIDPVGKMFFLAFIATSFLIALPKISQGQSDHKLLKRGNKEYQNKQYQNAEANFLKSLEKNPQNQRAAYNLGNALYRQGRFDEAANIFEGLANSSTNEPLKAQAFHNLGNSQLQKEDFQGSVKSYKEALKINPEDEDTRYNLAYALKKIQQQQQQQQQQDKEEKKDEKKDKEKEKQEQQKQQNQEKQINPQDAQRILDALNQQEKNVQDKRKMQMIQKRPANGKQW